MRILAFFTFLIAVTGGLNGQLSFVTGEDFFDFLKGIWWDITNLPDADLITLAFKLFFLWILGFFAFGTAQIVFKPFRNFWRDLKWKLGSAKRDRQRKRQERRDAPLRAKRQAEYEAEQQRQRQEQEAKKRRLQQVKDADKQQALEQLGSIDSMD